MSPHDKERDDDAPMVAISELSQDLVMRMMTAASMDERLDWQDVCYAATVAMKALALQAAAALGRSDDDMLEVVRRVVDLALKQRVMIEVVGAPPGGGLQ